MEPSGLPELKRGSWEAKAARVHRAESLRREEGRKGGKGGKERVERGKERGIESEKERANKSSGDLQRTPGDLF